MLVPKGPSTQYLKTLVPKTIKGMVFGTRVFKSWVLGPFGGVSTSCQKQLHHVQAALPYAGFMQEILGASPAVCCGRVSRTVDRVQEALLPYTCIYIYKYIYIYIYTHLLI